ncbi:MAG: signal peptidase I [Asgard group archaeon]|nr:signal peptidase I [Asgard group archaeon]
MSSSLSKFLKKIDIKETAIMIVIAIALFFLVKMMFGGVLGVSLVVIENGPCPNSSMCPTYDQGDMFLIFKNKPENIQLGDVIVYESATVYSRGTLIIHRVVNITVITDTEGDHYYFLVSGDNPSSNNYIDYYDSTTHFIPYEAVLGKTKLIIPKLGYVKLWLSIPDFIWLRYVLIAVLLGLAVYLIFAPDDKDKKKKDEEQEKTDAEVTKEESKEEDSKFSFKDILNTFWIKTKKFFVELVTVRKKRIKLIITASVIIFLIIFIPVLDTLIKSPGVETGIDNVVLLSATSFIGEDIVFLPFNIYFKHDGSWNTVLKSFEVIGIQNGSILATMKWGSYTQIEGDNIIGGSLIFDSNQFNANESLTISISYIIHYRFGSDVPQVFEDIFDPPYLQI